MRRALILCSVLALLVPMGVVSQAEEALPFMPSPCTADPATGYDPPATCQRIKYLYGPVHITPGDNLILFGPVTIEKPQTDGYMLRFKPDMVRASDMQVPPIEQLHLHHAVWISAGPSGHRAPFAAVGEEKTTLELPNHAAEGLAPAYYSGVDIRGSDRWLLNYMIHNQFQLSDNVFIVYEIDFLPKAAATAVGLTPITPVWLNVASFNGANPVYNTIRGTGEVVDGKQVCGFPKDQCADMDPFGKTDVVGNGDPGNGIGFKIGPTGTEASNKALREGTIYWMGGHLHPGGTWIDLDLWRDADNDGQIGAGESRRVFKSNASYFDPNGPVSWDVAMEVSRPDFRLQLKEGDTFIMNSYYESGKASWYEGMGIVVLFLAPGDTTGPDVFTAAGAASFDAAGGSRNVQITHGHLAEADNHCGEDPGEVCPDGAGEAPLQIGQRVRTTNVVISGFNYLPGQISTESVAIPQLARGQKLRFTNTDAPAVIFHTVTACKYPCNGSLGVSYPLANGESDLGARHQFDSLELGYGPPGVTAAANRHTYDLDTAPMDPGVYTYFCRIHPFMRGAFEVAPA